MKLKRMVHGLIGCLLLFFLIGFLDLTGWPLLALMVLFLLLGMGLINLIFQSKINGNLKIYALITGISSVIFSIGVSYGIIGIMGYYMINNMIYLSSVIVSLLGFIIGSIGTLVLLKNGGGPIAEANN